MKIMDPIILGYGRHTGNEWNQKSQLNVSEKFVVKFYGLNHLGDRSRHRQK